MLTITCVVSCEISELVIASQYCYHTIGLNSFAIIDIYLSFIAHAFVLDAAHHPNLALKRRDLAAACLHDERDVGQCLCIDFFTFHK